MRSSKALETAREIARLARDDADEAERERKLSAPVVDALLQSGFFRLCVPSSVGGGEADPGTIVAVCEELARGDAAPAWCIAVMSTAGMLAAYIPEEAAGEAYGSPDSVVGGVFAPRGRAVAEAGGYRITGRWPFSSGVDHCNWLLGGCFVEKDGVLELLESGKPDIRLCLFPAAEAEVIDTWSVSGLRGTGSHDIALAAALVPTARTASIISQPPVATGPLYAFPVFGLLALTISGVALGIGRAALDDLIELAGGKTPTASTRTLAERATTQSQLAQAEAGLRAARAYLYEAIADAWATATAGAAVPVEQRMALRLAATQATTAAAAATDVAYNLGGGSSIYETSPLQRRFRDVHAATQHMLVAPATWELTGRLLLGLPTDVAQL